MPDISALERVMSPVKGMGMTAVSAGGGVLVCSRVGRAIGAEVGGMARSCSDRSVGGGAGESGRQPAEKMMAAVNKIKKST
jgi:hypothetical protein